MSETGIVHFKTCAHPGCLCLVNPGEEYCGNFCRGVSQDSDNAHKADIPRGPAGRCGCNHAACEEARG